jgi:gliding motility-associated-like protein
LQDILYFGASFQYNYFLRKIVIILIFIGVMPNAFCQLIPVAPVMISVSVRPLTDTVVIDWKPSVTSGIDGYVVYEHRIIQGYLPYDSIWSINDPLAVRAIFEYPKVRQQAVEFFVAAYKINPPPYGYTASHADLVPYHQTIFMQLKNDSCNSNILLTWSNYIGWGTNLGYYRVFQIKDGINLQVVADNLLPSDTTYAVPVDPNRNYCFYICAINKADGTVTSLSNDSCIFTKTAVPPGFINADYASFSPNSTNPVTLRFSLDINSQLNEYQLYTSDNADNGFVPLHSPMTAQSDSIVVQDVLTSNSPKYYKLEVLNNCGRPTVSSNVATAMIIKGSVQANEVNLIWNQYKGWPNGVQQYTVYRIIGSDPAQAVGTVSTTNYTDDIGKLVGQQLSANICYYAEAVSNPDNLGKVNRSFTTNYCVDLSEAVFIPNAFTPNGDGQNDEFKPSFAFLPENYVMIVYNRYGFKVFESTDSLKGWDGFVGNGEKAPEGTYIYFIKFSSQSGKTIEKKGNISVIYP